MEVVGGGESKASRSWCGTNTVLQAMPLKQDGFCACCEIPGGCLLFLLGSFAWERHR